MSKNTPTGSPAPAEDNATSADNAAPATGIALAKNNTAPTDNNTSPAISRLARLRSVMNKKGIDAYVVRNISDLIWITGFEQVFDEELAHTAFITQDVCIIHTDSRYSGSLRSEMERLLSQSLSRSQNHQRNELPSSEVWQIDDICTKNAKRISTADFVLAALQESGFSQKAKVAFDENCPFKLYRSYKEKLTNYELIFCPSEILALREVKDEAEIEKLKAVQVCAEKGFLEVIETLHTGMTEQEIALKLEFTIRAAGAQSLSFPSIVAAGAHGANPHAQPSAYRIQRGDLIVFDFGAKKCGYCSDTTRVVCMGVPNKEQLRAYNAVKLANSEVRKALSSQKSGKQMHELSQEILANEGFENLMGHALGHGVGIDIHENPTLSLRNEKQLSIGNVVTDEPGVYLNGKFGIRIEDCGVISANGYENFCSLSHELITLE